MVWYEALKGYEYESVHRALDQWLISQSKPPAISDIRILCRPMSEVYKALPKPKKSDEQIELDRARIAAMYASIGVKNKDRDWIAYWQNILAHKAEYPHVTEVFAKQALVNLGVRA